MPGRSQEGTWDRRGWGARHCGAPGVVTSDSISEDFTISAALARFADEKVRAGRPVKMVTGTSFLSCDARHRFWMCATTDCVGWGGGTGDATANALRSWLQRNHLTQNIGYVLLIGDPRTSTSCYSCAS